MLFFLMAVVEGLYMVITPIREINVFWKGLYLCVIVSVVQIAR